MKKSIINDKSSFVILFILGISFISLLTARPVSAAEKNDSGKYVQTGDEKFDKVFREGRDLIDDEQWKQAAEKFGGLVERYPDNKSVDVALYWLAFCHKKLKNFKEADAALDRLLGKFPASSWAADASVMKMEIAAPLGKLSPAAASSATIFGSVSGASPAQPPRNTAKTGAGNLPPQYKSYPGFAVGAPPAVPLDRADEIKIAAFQSLLAADPKRAIETLGELFKPEAKASEIFKQEALRVLRRPSISRSASTSSAANQNFSFSIGGDKINKQFVPLLRETLLRGFQSQRSVKIRKEIIFALAALEGDQSADELAQLYKAEKEPEIKKAIIASFGGNSSNGFTTAYAYNLGVYTNSVSGSAGKNLNKGFDKLLEIVRTEKDLELRRLAFSTVREFAGWSAREEVIEMFAQMYDDKETDEQFKISIIHSLAESKQNRAEMKLLDIARSDKSDKLRLEAIRSLGNSTNPAVLKFLEDLIK